MQKIIKHSSSNFLVLLLFLSTFCGLWADSEEVVPEEKSTPTQEIDPSAAIEKLAELDPMTLYELLQDKSRGQVYGFDFDQSLQMHIHHLNRRMRVLNQTIHDLNARIFELENRLMDRDGQILDLHLQLQRQMDINAAKERVFDRINLSDFVASARRVEYPEDDTGLLPPIRIPVEERIARARKLRDEGDVLAAQILLSDVLDEGPNEIAYLDLASCFYLQERFDATKQLLHRVLELNPSNGKALLNMAMVYYVEDSSPEGLSLSRSYYLAAIEAEEPPDLSFEALLFPVEVENDESFKKEQKRELKEEKKEQKKLEKQLEEERKKLKKQQELELEQQKLNHEQLEYQRKLELEKRKLQFELEQQKRLEEERLKLEQKKILEQQRLEQQQQLEEEQFELERKKQLELEQREQEQKKLKKKTKKEQKKLEKEKLEEQKKLERQEQLELERQKRIELERKRRLEREQKKLEQQQSEEEQKPKSKEPIVL